MCKFLRCAALCFFALVFPALASAEEVGTVRLAWQPIGAIQGQTGEILKQTNALAITGLRGELTPFFAGGAPINEGMATGEFDVATYGLGPAIALMARGVQTKFVALINYFKAGVLVEAKSPVKTLADLRGRKLAFAFGSGVHRTTIELLRRAGLTPDTDVQLVNLSPADGSTALLSGEIDAFMIWDPSYIDLLQRQPVRSIYATDDRALFNATVMTDDFLSKRRRAAIEFLKAQQLAVWYMVSHKAETAAWMAAEAPISIKAILAASEYDRNWNARSPADVDLSLHDDDIQKIQQEAQFLYEHKFVPKLINVRDHVDLSLYQEARKELGDGAIAHNIAANAK
jgi:ABC-type nitrate/sulfonate/bicarbonate transport system substrate-binding protein